MRYTRREFCALAGTALLGPGGSQSAGGWRAGAASVDITPTGSLWMAGFAARTRPAQGTALPLRARALAIQAGEGPPAILVTADLLGVTARLSEAVYAGIARRHHIPRSALLVNASHTHCGPIVDEQLAVAYELTAAQWQAVRDYTASLEHSLLELVDRALAGIRPATLAFSIGTARFARNRRVQFSPDGPVDHAVPVLRVSDADGSPIAIVFGYACHNTTLRHDFVQYHGDYAGVAQAALERRHRGVVALFVTGCGADVNPDPRGTLALVEAHGTALADAVDRALPAAARIPPGLHSAYATVELPYAAGEPRQRWMAALPATIEEVYLRRHATLMEQIAARQGGLPVSQTAPVQVWRLGPHGSATDGSVTLVALGGEVVVDYALRLAREFPDRRIWAAGYSNDVFGYVPSRRVLREGGYEGADAMVYYGRPGPFTDDVEELLVSQVRRLAGT